MGFIKGKAYPIVNSMAKKGNIKAKNLLLDAPQMAQEQVDNIVAQLLSTKGKEDNVENKNNKETKESEEKVEEKSKQEKLPNNEDKKVKGSLEDELNYLIKKEKTLLAEYEESEFAKDFKNVIAEKKKFITKLESVLKSED